MTSSSNLEKNAASNIKSFQYLDTEKMYSISSQIFEGLTEYVLNSKTNSSQEVNSQRGRDFFNGRVLADIIEESSGTTEKKFLHDYSYTLFEQALIKSDRVLELNEDNAHDLIHSIDDKSFVKVTGRLLFNDTRQVTHTLENFNDLGYALWYVTEGNQLEDEKKRILSEVNSVNDRNKKAVLKERINSITKYAPLMKAKGLYQNPEFLKQVAYALNYGYSDQFEVQLHMFTGEVKALFSSILKREMLKENEDILIKKYSRRTEKKFTVFGIPTQTQGRAAKNSFFEDSDADDSVQMKEAMMGIVSVLGNVEDTFTGKLSYEYVIDPIAVYIEI